MGRFTRPDRTKLLAFKRVELGGDEKYCFGTSKSDDFCLRDVNPGRLCEFPPKGLLLVSLENVEEYV
jgi:hypothetical protein